MNETVLNQSLSAPPMTKEKTSYKTTSNVGGESETTHIFITSHDFSASYNIPPTSGGVIIYMKQDPGSKRSYVIEPLKFGLLPEWAKPTNPQAVKRGTDLGPAYSREVQLHQSKYFNCRKETISQEKSVWTFPRGSRRCVVPIQGYFEWQKTKADKTPYFVFLKKSPLMFLVGLYSHNVNYNDTELVPPDHQYFSSFSIATGTAAGEGSNDLSWLHPRKPIFVKPNTPEWFEWLDPNTPWSDKLLDTVLNCETNVAYEDVTAHPVSSMVGNPGFKGPEAIQEVKVTQKSIAQFFSPSPKKESKPSHKLDFCLCPSTDDSDKKHLSETVLMKAEEKRDSLKRKLSGGEISAPKKSANHNLGSESYIQPHYRDYNDNEDDSDDDDDDGDEDEDDDYDNYSQ